MVQTSVDAYLGHMCYMESMSPVNVHIKAGHPGKQSASFPVALTQPHHKALPENGNSPRIAKAQDMQRQPALTETDVVRAL